MNLLSFGVEATPELNRIVAHCLEKNPGERFQSASDLSFSLKSLLTGHNIWQLEEAGTLYSQDRSCGWASAFSFSAPYHMPLIALWWSGRDDRYAVLVLIWRAGVGSVSGKIGNARNEDNLCVLGPPALAHPAQPALTWGWPWCRCRSLPLWGLLCRGL